MSNYDEDYMSLDEYDESMFNLNLDSICESDGMDDDLLDDTDQYNDSDDVYESDYDDDYDDADTSNSYDNYDDITTSNAATNMISRNVYETALQNATASLKESTELLAMLQQCEVVDDLFESAFNESDDMVAEYMMDLYENGPLFEAVSRGDKNTVKNLCKSHRDSIIKEITSLRNKLEIPMTAYNPKAFWRVAGTLSLASIDQEVVRLFKTRAWQFVCVCNVDSKSAIKVENALNEKFGSKLNGYKILFTSGMPSVKDWLSVGRNKSTHIPNSHFVIIDKSVDKEVNATIDKSAKSAKSKKK